MKNVLLFLLVVFSLDASAQDVIGKRTKKRTATKAKAQPLVAKREAEAYPSRNGVIKAREMGDNEKIDSIQKSDIQPSHVNKNYNESVPPLSPSNGGN
ncbi:MAG: hypothetical protein WC716_15665 [Chitinophagaceae bacterium]|jgi:hypothetical protein